MVGLLILGTCSPFTQTLTRFVPVFTILLTVMTWFTVGKGLPLDEASVGPASRASGSETRDAFKNKAAEMHIFILNAV